MLKVAVIDGQGGGIGKVITEKIRRAMGEEVEIIALGTNALAASLMLRAGANEGASGENAFRQVLAEVDAIVGPISIIVANSMLGELTPSMAEVVATARIPKVLLPLTRGNIELVGLSAEPLPHLVDKAILRLQQLVFEKIKREGKQMCEANAYLIENGKEELVMERVDKILPVEDGLFLENIFGQQKTIKARIKEMGLVSHRILLEKE